MFKRSASRTQRSKGLVRAKQILQILLLLGICFWLVYQVKYSHDKKKAILDDKGSKISQGDDLGLKFGRKELHPRVYDKQHKAEVDEDDEHEEVGEREDVGGVQLVENDVKKEVDSEEDDAKKVHEEVELEEEEEEEEVKNDEPENHEKPGEVEEEEEGLKELEDREQEKPQEEGDDHEEFIDEEKDKEEEADEKEDDGNGEEVKNIPVEDDTTVEDEEEKGKEDEKDSDGNGEEVKTKQVEDDTIVEDEEDQDRDGINREAHEAREEHYKGDDASSAVTQDTEVDTLEAKEFDKSPVPPNNESRTDEIIEKSFGSEISNGGEDHDNATDVEISKSADENTTELANSSPTDETEMGNAAAVNLNATLTETEEALTDQLNLDPELIESSSNHTEGTNLVESGNNLRLPSNTTESSETNTQDEDPGGHNEAVGVETE